MRVIINFLKSSYEEFKKVRWPSKKQTTHLTQYVISVSVGVGAFVGAIDYVFKEALKLILG